MQGIGPGICCPVELPVLFVRRPLSAQDEQEDIQEDCTVKESNKRD